MHNRFFLLLAITLPLLLSNAFSSPTQPADPGWPREHEQDGNRLIVYQPQVDAWTNFQDLSWRMAISIQPKDAKQEVLGALRMKGKTLVDADNKMVTIAQLEITGSDFPSADPATATRLTELIKGFLPPSLSVSLHRIVASFPKDSAPSGVQLKNDPPKIFVAYRPSILLSVDGKPTLAEIRGTDLQFVVNSQWPIFFQSDASSYYVPVDQQWITAQNLNGPWTETKKLPAQMSKVPQEQEWSDLKKIIPPPAKNKGVIPEVFYSEEPSEIILFDGDPKYTKIPETQLNYATNTNSVVFLHQPTKQFYYLTAGRWFTAKDLQGPWTYATPNLPPDFAQIPPGSPAAAVLVSVPGTEEAKDAVLLAQVPTTMVIKAAEAQSAVKVTYSGEPHFAPIEGTAMSYATNTPDKVIKLGDTYYLCLQAIWFTSRSPEGPWTTATNVPKEIYTIPPSSPVYNVTYVTQSANPDGTIKSSYTAGYLGAYLLGAETGVIIASGSGYYYPPAIYPVYGYAGYYPYALTYGAYYRTPYYNAATGAYGWAGSASGPYGSAAWASGYNPYTGTYARGGTVATPYGTRSAAQAYNPYTGTYAQTRQGSSPTAQWGSSYVSQGNWSAESGHYSTANGTVAGAAGSDGGKAVASSTAWGNSAAAKTASGNMYAGHDGNVYKNTGSGWEKYSDGGWNPVSKPTSPNFSQAAESGSGARGAANPSRESSTGLGRGGGSGSSELQGLQREAGNRRRGDVGSHNFQRSGGARDGRRR